MDDEGLAMLKELDRRIEYVKKHELVEEIRPLEQIRREVLNDWTSVTSIDPTIQKGIEDFQTTGSIQVCADIDPLEAELRFGSAKKWAERFGEIVEVVPDHQLVTQVTIAGEYWGDGKSTSMKDQNRIGLRMIRETFGESFDVRTFAEIHVSRFYKSIKEQARSENVKSKRYALFKRFIEFLYTERLLEHLPKHVSKGSAG